MIMRTRFEMRTARAFLKVMLAVTLVSLVGDLESVL